MTGETCLLFTPPPLFFLSLISLMLLKFITYVLLKIFKDLSHMVLPTQLLLSNTLKKIVKKNKPQKQKKTKKKQNSSYRK